MSDINLSHIAVNYLLAEKNSDIIRIYIYYAAYGNADKEACCERLGIKGEDYDTAMNELIEARLCPAPKKSVDMKQPSYSSADITKVVSEDSHFRDLIAYTEKQTGRVLTVTDTQVLLNIYHWLGFPCDLIMLIVSYSASLAAKTPGKRVSLVAIQKMANAWSDKGIDTVEKADLYLKTLEKQNGYIARASSRLGISAVTQSVDNYLRAWSDMGIALELIDRAADISAVKFGSINIRYINGIINGWYKAGLLSVAAVEAAEGRREHTAKPSPRPEKQKKSSELEILRRMKEYSDNEKTNN